MAKVVIFDVDVDGTLIDEHRLPELCRRIESRRCARQAGARGPSRSIGDRDRRDRHAAQAGRRQRQGHGAVAYAADCVRPGLVHAVLVGSTIARGRIAAMDVSRAQAAQGVRLVMTHENAPRLKPTPVFATIKGPLSAAGTGVPVLNTDEIFWHGQPVALVAEGNAGSLGIRTGAAACSSSARW